MEGTNSATYSYLANSPLVEHIQFKQNGALRMTTTKSHDHLNRLTAIGSVNASAVVLDSHAYAYNLANERVAMTNSDNSRWDFGYDSLGQVTSGKKYWSDHVPVAGEQFEYGFDDIGNRVSAKDGGDQFGGNLRTVTYNANALNQYTSRMVSGYVNILGSATNTATVTVNDHPTYRHGDFYRAELQFDNTSSAVYPSLTNLAVLNQGTNADLITNVTGNVFLPQTPETFSYDDDGNQASDGRWTNHWDAENRLISMESLTNGPAGSKLRLNFGYDYQGRRITKTVEQFDGSQWSLVLSLKYTYDGWNLIAIFDGDNNLLQSFRWGMDLSGSEQGAGGVSGLLSMAIHSGPNAGTSIYAYDGNGNVTTLMNATNGTVSAQYEYGPFGEVIRATGPMAKANPFRFSTIYQDDETDMLMYLHRPYSASQGRFLSRDPLGELGANLLYNIAVLDVFGEESRENPYLLVDNDPVHHYDILGLQSVPVSLAEAMASGNVAQVESILAGMEEGDAGWAIAQAWLKKVAQCEALWAAYKALDCKGCKGCTTKEQAVANAACLTAEIAGRAAYLKLKCDYCLAGSIARGSAKAEKGHQIQLAEKTAALAKCTAAALTLPSATPPPPPIVP